jgi:hypothetical protein
MALIRPPLHDTEELEAAREVAILNFRRHRLMEPLEAYLEHFDRYQGVIEELMETTVDLTELRANALQLLRRPDFVEVFRYLAGPPISTADLTVVAETSTLRPTYLEANPELLDRLVDVVLTALDRRRFPWLAERREPAESERAAAVLASAAMMAMRRLETERRGEHKKQQEQRVEETLIAAGLIKTNTRKMNVLEDAPAPGEFCRESTLGTRKADFVVRLWDRRVLALECKVSNSATNSVKRLNNDAAMKAESWRSDFGTISIIPAAVLAGVYKVRNLADAQQRGLTLFWEHDLGALVRWIEATRQRV